MKRGRAIVAVCEISLQDVFNSHRFPDSPTRATWRTSVAEIAAKAQAAFTVEVPVYIEQAMQIVLDGDVNLLSDGQAKAANPCDSATEYFADFITVTADLPLAHAVTTFQDDRVFEELSDATPTTIAFNVKAHFAHMALTRGKARAFHNALNISKVGSKNTQVSHRVKERAPRAAPLW